MEMEQRPIVSIFVRIDPSIFLGSILVGLSAVGVIAAESSGEFSKGLPVYAMPLALVFGFCALFYVLARFLFFTDRTHREVVGALDLTERKYMSLFRNALDGILIFDPKGTCVEANPAACVLLGCTRRHLVGGSVPNFLLPHSAGGSRPARAEARVLRVDGRTAVIEYTVAANFLPGLHVALLRDITIQKQAEIALRESDYKFEQMAENIQEVFWIIDAKARRVVYVNGAFEAITGLPRQAIIEAPGSLAATVHPNDRTRILSRID